MTTWELEIMDHIPLDELPYPLAEPEKIEENENMALTEEQTRKVYKAKEEIKASLYHNDACKNRPLVLKCDDKKYFIYREDVQMVGSELLYFDDNFYLLFDRTSIGSVSDSPYLIHATLVTNGIALYGFEKKFFKLVLAK